MGWEGAGRVARVVLIPPCGRCNYGGPGDRGRAGAAFRRPHTRKQVSGCWGKAPSPSYALGTGAFPGVSLTGSNVGFRVAGAVAVRARPGDVMLLLQRKEIRRRVATSRRALLKVLEKFALPLNPFTPNSVAALSHHILHSSTELITFTRFTKALK